MSHPSVSKHHSSSRIALFGAAVLTAVLVLAGCAAGVSTQHREVAPFAGALPMQAQVAQPGEKPPAGATTLEVLVLRPASVGADRPVNVYLNDRYVTSLLPAGYTRMTLCPGAAQMAAVLGDAQQRHQGRQEAAQTFEFQAGYLYMLEVQPDAGRASRVRLVHKNVDAEQLKGYRQQAHAVNRSKGC